MNRRSLGTVLLAVGALIAVVGAVGLLTGFGSSSAHEATPTRALRSPPETSLPAPTRNRAWEAATDAERRVLVNELVDHVAVYPDHLEVAVHGVPKLNGLLAEVGLVEQSGFSRVGGGT